MAIVPSVFNAILRFQLCGAGERKGIFFDLFTTNRRDRSGHIFVSCALFACQVAETRKESHAAISERV
jgi:hypothetical protein